MMMMMKQPSCSCGIGLASLLKMKENESHILYKCRHCGAEIWQPRYEISDEIWKTENQPGDPMEIVYHGRAKSRGLVARYVDLSKAKAGTVRMTKDGGLKVVRLKRRRMKRKRGVK